MPARPRGLVRPTPSVVRRQVVLEEHDLSPDGTFAVVSRRFVAGNAYRSHLWLVPVPAAGARGRAVPRRLTDGPYRDERPTISPDGGRVAFTRHAAGDPEAMSRLVVLDLAGVGAAGGAGAGGMGSVGMGATRPGAAAGRAGAKPAATQLPARSPEGRSVKELAWSPDGRWLAYTMRADPPRHIVGPAAADESPRARRIRRLGWRYDETGHVDRWRQLFVVPASGRTMQRDAQVTAVEGGVSGIAWRPDGTAIAFVADPRPDADRRPRSSIWSVDVSGIVNAPGAGRAGGRAVRQAREPVEILALAGPAHSPAWSPDGRWIAAVGVDIADPFDDSVPALFVGPADGGRPAVPLAIDLDRPPGSWVDTDLTGWTASASPGPTWDGSDGVVVLVGDRGRQQPWRFPVNPDTGRPAGDPVRLVAGDIAASSVRARAGRVTLLATLGSRPPELGVATADGDLHKATTFGSAWARGLEWPEMRVVDVPGPGGPIETWIASPADAGDGPLPTIVDVHGGPLGAWAPAPSLEVVLLCARGYRVVLPNIRGSATYGGDWIRPQLGDWGGVDADDVHAALDHAVRLGLADPERLGALGLSYGGFMVNWLVGTTDRFRAAVSENGVSNQVSAWAQSDEGPEFCRAARMGDPTTPAGRRRLWRQSPLRHVASIRTPLLMLQAEADLRCPAGDNEQLFVALRWLGREVEYVLYPDEYHVYMAAGRPDRRVDRMTRMLEWFDRFLRP